MLPGSLLRSFWYLHFTCLVVHAAHVRLSVGRHIQEHVGQQSCSCNQTLPHLDRQLLVPSMPLP